MIVMSSFDLVEKGHCQQVIIPVPNAKLLMPVVIYNTIRLLVRIVNSTSVIIFK